MESRGNMVTNRLIKNKFCCNGNHATLINTLWSMKKRGHKWIMALYQCSKCKEFSLRGDKHSDTWNTYVEIINKSKVDSLITQKRKHKKWTGKNSEKSVGITT